MKPSYMRSGLSQASNGDFSHNHPSRIVTGRSGDRSWWLVGADRIEMYPGSDGWNAHVERVEWGGAALDVDGHFVTDAEARAWCEQMAATLAQDHADETDA